MYAVDAEDKVLSLEGIPYPSAGAAMPLILANDNNLLLAYEVAPEGEQYAVLKFNRPYAHYFGSPNDETFGKHPLAQRGLAPYGVFEIRNSSRIRALERMNNIHSKHEAHRFDGRRHFIFTFHDNTFECVAGGLILAATIPNESEGTAGLLALMASHLI